ncbi:MAG: hypothetical protein LBF02_00575 [Mycoplasmataceae bacterium]|jgi:hypothetical protein|nr:hypothetical protein [Mycoplasmataceae bacterium]
MIFNNNQVNNTNKPENSKKLESIIKKMGKKENYYVNESTNKYIKEGDEIVMSKFSYSGRTPKPDIIGEILKRLEKIDSKLDIQGEEIKEIKEVQKLQGEKITNIEQVQKIQGEKLDKVIILNNLKIE